MVRERNHRGLSPNSRQRLRLDNSVGSGGCGHSISSVGFLTSLAQKSGALQRLYQSPTNIQSY